MRTVTFGINISLDGYCDHTIANPDEELLDYFTQLMGDVDLLFFGRIMYQLMFPYWCDVAKNQSGTAAENKFAERITAIDKVVISRSLENAENSTRIVRANPAAELRQLKEQQGGKILVDSVSMLPELIGLIDEFNMVIHPVFAGKGRPLLSTGNLLENIPLRLTDTRIFKSGYVALRYLKQ